MAKKEFHVIFKEIINSKTKPESTEYEIKESFSYSAMDNYLKYFASFANNRGGYLIFGITDNMDLVGMNEKSLNFFSRLDPERLTNEINVHFMPSINVSHYIWEYNKANFGVFEVFEVKDKPVITVRDAKDVLKEGEIYFRYSGRSEKIKYGELNSIIQLRIQSVSDKWLRFMERVAKIGVENAFVFDANQVNIDDDGIRMFIIDENLANQIEFIKQGEFVEKEGAPTVMLIGEGEVRGQQIVNKKVETIIETNIWDKYPYSFKEMWNILIERNPRIKQNLLHKYIRENKIKDNPNFSGYNFRSKEHQEEYLRTGKTKGPMVSNYNEEAIKLFDEVFRKQ
ncbi:MAG: hypothetical protein CL609_23735 [Anaerolineaceae bacterium]|nr:hypothetical protein [Anaerolineaceae bacterium]